MSKNNSAVFSKQESRIIRLDRMCYKNDQLSRMLALLGLLANVFYFVTFYKLNNNWYYQIMIGVSIIYNLLFMLTVFLSSEGVKTYDRKYSVILMIVGVLQIVRIFIFPRMAYEASTAAEAQMENTGFMSTEAYVALIVYLIISAVLLISSGLISFIKSSEKRKYENKEGRIVNG